MYIFELLAILLSALMLGLFIFTNIRHSKLLLGLVGLLSIVLVVQIASQGLRWNFSLLYLSGLILTPLLLYMNIKHTPFAVSKIKKSVKLVGVLFTVVSSFLLYAFPVPKLTVPNGLYPVGTTSYDVTDSSRIEIYGETT